MGSQWGGHRFASLALISGEALMTAKGLVTSVARIMIQASYYRLQSARAVRTESAGGSKGRRIFWKCPGGSPHADRLFSSGSCPGSASSASEAARSPGAFPDSWPWLVLTGVVPRHQAVIRQAEEPQHVLSVERHRRGHDADVNALPANGPKSLWDTVERPTPAEASDGVLPAPSITERPDRSRIYQRVV